MELEQIGCVKTHKSCASMHLALTQFLFCLLQMYCSRQTDFFFTLHKFTCCGDWSHWCVLDKSACFDWRLNLSSIKSPEHATATKTCYISVPNRFLLNFNTRFTGCFAFILYSDWIYIFFCGLFHQEETRAVFSLGIYLKWSRQAGECVLSVVSPGDSGQLYEQCSLCSLIDWVRPLVAKCAITAESHDNVIHPQWKPGLSVSLLTLAFPIITVPCPNICPQWKLASAIFSPPVQLLYRSRIPSTLPLLHSKAVEFLLPV